MGEEEEAPVLNAMIEDYLARAGSPEEQVMLLHIWLQLGTEYMAREAGKTHARDVLQSLDRFVRDAKPSRPWKP